MFKPRFKAFLQMDMKDCGPTCLKMIAHHYGKHLSLDYLREHSYLERDGVSMAGLAYGAEKIGLRTYAAEVTYQQLAEEAPLPCIAYWRQDHFLVVHDIKPGRNGRPGRVCVADPAHGLATYTTDEFMTYWASATGTGLVLLCEPAPEFYEQDPDEAKPSPTGAAPTYRFLYRYFQPYRKYLVQLGYGLLAASLIGLITPFLTQAMIDYGVGNQNRELVYTLLIAQLCVFAGSTFIDVVRDWILLMLSVRINIALVLDFLAKMMRLPLGFFDAKNIGDLQQRIRDHQRIEEFLTTSSMDVLFSLFNILIFGTIIAVYNGPIFIIFTVGTALQTGWIVLFMRRRKVANYKLFNAIAASNTSELELITGIEEIKLNNCETDKLWKWEGHQAKIFRAKQRSLQLEQYQMTGSQVFNQLKNILITFWAATAVLDGTLTFGMLIAISFIIGQLNGPFLKLIEIVQKGQDAWLSLERLQEIHGKHDEDASIAESYLVPDGGDITLRNVSFRYGSPDTPLILDNVSFTIPHGKTTAIVGPSGSGKTTLVKLLLKFYQPQQGEIAIDRVPLRNLSSRAWRGQCGAVMQDGYIFADTIARNIAVGGDIDKPRLLKAARTACIDQFVESLPLNYNTMVGMAGVGVSGGQKQRLLIARMVYKNPQFLLLDEATSALDASNELRITENLSRFARGRTTLVIAHRLSTVKNADQILVLLNGQVAEQGTHRELVETQGEYYRLIRNQLELGVS